MFGLTEDQAITLLKTPLEELKDPTDRYVAASHLINYPTERSIRALIEVIQDPNPDLYNRIARRKALESLGRLKAKAALPVIQSTFTDEDCYTVENAVWAIGEIGTEDESILEEMSNLLKKPNQTYRVIIQTLAKLDYVKGIEQIKKFLVYWDKSVASAAITSVSRLTKDISILPQVVEFLQHENINTRRASIQDLMDAGYYDAIPQISHCPVSIAFRLRGIRHLGSLAIEAGKNPVTDVIPYLDQVIRDNPDDLELVHEYDKEPTLEFVIGELYHTDFGRCYLGSKTLLELYLKEAPEALLKTFAEEAHNDYGAHYHVVKLLGQLKYAPAYDLLVEALQNKAPQFQKSRAAAAISLGSLRDKKAIPVLLEGLKSNIFHLQYACLMALEDLGDTSGRDIVEKDSDIIIYAKVNSLNKS